MAMLRESATAKPITLRPRHLVGRSRLAHLRLTELNVSGEHAMLIWRNSRWELHDLGSRNGTYLNGERLESGARMPIAGGMRIGFASAKHTWRVVDDSPPSAMVMEEEKEEPLLIVGEVLALPDENDPKATLYKDRAGDWCLDRDGECRRVKDGQQLTVSNRKYTLILPEQMASTWCGEPLPPSIDTIALRFAVSQDEEYVHLKAIHGDQQIDLGARSHNYLLLTLARARLEEQSQCGTASAMGWQYVDELASSLGMDETHLNVSVFRSRKTFGEAGILGAAGVIERRKPTKQIRLGVNHLTIEQI